jgi:energy-coupling factor transporter ATP-binding protein EcfA2
LFHAKKTKLFKDGKYFRNLDFHFKKSERILFFGENFSGKTSLAKIFAGMRIYNPKAMKVKIDNKRYDYPIWQKLFCGAYFFDPKIFSEKSLMEFILGKDKEQINSSEIENVIKVISENQFIASKISSINNVNSSCVLAFNNNVSCFALQALHCIVNKKQLIIIDNIWIDLNYNDIIKIIEILSEKLEDSIIIVFSKENNNYLTYQQKYELGDEIRKIT